MAQRLEYAELVKRTEKDFQRIGYDQAKEEIRIDREQYLSEIHALKQKNG